MKRIAISGYYGFNNIGDEAVLEAILKNVRSAVPDAEIYVFSAEPEKTAELHGVFGVGRMSPWGILKTLARCHILISGGGSLLQDVTGHLSVIYYLLLIVAAKLMGKRVMVYSQGIGPIRKMTNRVLTRLVLSRADAITVREPKSRLDLIEIGIQAERIIVTADPVVSLGPDPQCDVSQHISLDLATNAIRIGLAFRGQDMKYGAAERLAEAISLVRENVSAEVILIPYYRKQDLPMVERLESILGNSVQSVRTGVRVQEMINITRDLDVLVGSRLHSLIIAAVCPTPMVAVSYDPKIEYFMDTIHRKVTSDIRDMDPRLVAEAILQELQEREKNCLEIRGHIENLNQSLQRNEAILKELLKIG